MSEALDLRKLSAPFPPDEIEWRIGSTTKDKSRGLALAYITSRHVMDRLDEVCGPEGWQCRYMETPKGRMLCTISIKIGSDWVEKSDGAGDTDVEGDKGAISDALKRAAVPWGIGRYLYSLESPWVELENNKIKSSEIDKLQRILKRQLGGKGGLKAAEKPREQPKPADRTTLTTIQRKELYGSLKSDLEAESAKGSDAITRFMTDAGVKADIAKLDGWAADFRREAAEVYKLSRAAEDAGMGPLQVKVSVKPSFDHLAPDANVGDIIDQLDLNAQEQERG